MGRLELGDVVIDNRRPGTRGVVVHARGQGYSLGFFPMPTHYAAEIGPGHWWCFDALADDVSVLPPEMHTARERVLGASVRWLPPDWREPDDGEWEPDSHAFAVLRALLPSAVEAQVFGGYRTEPTTIKELALEVAAALDERRSL